ncbi:unnamed protein product [Absidia cylindrospora]
MTTTTKTMTHKTTTKAATTSTTSTYTKRTCMDHGGSSSSSSLEIDCLKKKSNCPSVIAPLYIPLQRRIQMLSIVIWLSAALSLTALFLVFWTQPFWFPLALMYMAYICLDPAPVQGGRRLQSVREWSLWKNIADYFPIQIIKEHDLDPSGNYLFGYHPHGILCFGAVSTFATEGSGFSRLFPGVIPRLATVPFTLLLPFYRDLLLSMGFCSSSRASCEHVLRSGPGESLAIVVGGAVEALSSSPGTNRLVLKKRLGFIRLAIRQQASLVPVFAFGEADLYHQYRLTNDGIADWLRSFIKKLCGIAVPLFYGRGIFNYDFGLIPYRRPVTVIVGKPIPVPKLEKDQVEPTKEQILQVQDLYIKELTGIYDRYKDMYAQDRQQELEIIA